MFWHASRKSKIQTFKAKEILSLGRAYGQGVKPGVTYRTVQVSFLSKKPPFFLVSSMNRLVARKLVANPRTTAALSHF